MRFLFNNLQNTAKLTEKPADPKAASSGDRRKIAKSGSIGTSIDAIPPRSELLID